MKQDEKKKTTKRILIYLGITFLLTYGLEIGVIRPLIYSVNPNSAMLGQTLISVAMLIPAFSVLLTRLFTQEGFHNCHILPGKGVFKKTIQYYLMAWFGMGILIVFGAVVYFLIFPDNFDPTLSVLALTFQSAGAELPQSALLATLVSQLAMALLLGPSLNCVFCFGEEWGWRGYLLPKMQEKMSILPVVLISGVIWGLWHAPLTVMGHNYGIDYAGYPVTGILAMCGFCIVIGSIFSYLSIKANSILPAVIAHGSINAFSAAASYFTKDGGNPFIGPVNTGIIGGCGFILAAVIVTIVLMKDEKKTRHEKNI